MGSFSVDIQPEQKPKPEPKPTPSQEAATGTIEVIHAAGELALELLSESGDD
jgi:hypothetical protein